MLCGLPSSALVSGSFAILSGGVLDMRETKYTVPVNRHGDVSQSGVIFVPIHQSLKCESLQWQSPWPGSRVKEIVVEAYWRAIRP